jgi:hypothetical protein
MKSHHVNVFFSQGHLVFFFSLWFGMLSLDVMFRQEWLKKDSAMAVKT